MNRRRLLILAAMATAGAACGFEETSDGPTAGASPRGLGSTPSPTTRTPSERSRTTSGPSNPPSPSPSPTPTEEPEPSLQPEHVETIDPPEPAASATARDAVAVTCRQEWGASPAGPGGVAQTITGIMVHHSAVQTAPSQTTAERLQGYQRYHMEQGWPDIAYHLAVDPAGELYELRSAGIAGDTFTDYDPNGWFLILADGNYDEEAPTQELLHGLAVAISWAAHTFQVSVDATVSHRDRAATTCPGRELDTRLSELTDRSRELLVAGPPRLSTCSPPDGSTSPTPAPTATENG